MDARKLKAGPLQRYKSSLFSSKWKDCFGVLFADSTLCFYNQQSDKRPVESIFLKNVIPYICVGLMTDRMPVRRPPLPVGVAVQRLVGIGMDPRAEKVHWLLFPSETELELWFSEILKTFPPPPADTVPSNRPPQSTQPSSAYVPPPRYPDAPPAPVGNYVYPQSGGSTYPNHNLGYGPNPPPQPSNTTVIIDRGGYGSSGFGTGSGFGFGSGSGLGFGSGLLAGSLLGYGVGSFFTPHYHSFGGFPSSHGFGGGYIQDNDTYITNNYYSNSDNTSHAVTNELTSHDRNENSSDQQHHINDTSYESNHSSCYDGGFDGDGFDGDGFDDDGFGDY